nr:SDR family NAD(P)-dependent oxidoreductase [Chryseobacterium ginsenosidimutans]
MQKTIFITGASSGLGKTTAKLFQSKGWNVIATMRNPKNETETYPIGKYNCCKTGCFKERRIRENNR